MYGLARRGPIAEWLARRTTVRLIRGSNSGPSPTQGCLNALFARHKAFPDVLDARDNVC